MRALRIVSLRMGTPQVVGGPSSSESFESSFLKHAVQGPVSLDSYGVSGDVQADTRHHGGRDKAICVYPGEHYPTWIQELGEAASEAGPGAFGENLTLEGATEADVAIGDRFQAKSAVVLEVSQPRGPCWKVSRRWGVPDMAARVEKTGRTGWYCRVLTPGTLAEGDEMAWIAGPHVEWTVERAHRLIHSVREHPAQALELAEVPSLSAATRASLYRKLDTLGYVPMACAVHDLLEDAAVRRVPLDLDLSRAKGEVERHRAHIRDLRTENGAEYVELSSRRLVRLDRVVRVAPVT